LVAVSRCPDNRNANDRGTISQCTGDRSTDNRIMQAPNLRQRGVVVAAGH
jgi:hypothetical protein